MSKLERLMSLDVGEKRIGVATAESDVKIAVPYGFIEVDGGEIEKIERLLKERDIEVVVVGRPRNQQGETTKQTDIAERFAEKIRSLGSEVVFRDESLTSVLAEERLMAMGKPYQKGDVDAYAATLILQDYIEEKYR